MRGISSFLLGLFVGGLVAGGLALLFAPHRGEITRQMLAERTQELSVRARGTAEQLGGRAQDLMQRGERMARQGSEEPREQMPG